MVILQHMVAHARDSGPRDSLLLIYFKVVHRRFNGRSGAILKGRSWKLTPDLHHRPTGTVGEGAGIGLRNE